jgi:SnoaL-like domain
VLSTPEEAIRRAIALYFHLVDEKDVEGITHLFPEDGSLEIRGNTYTGPASMKAFLADLFSKAPADVRTVHIVSAGQVIDVDGDKATATTDVMVVGFKDGAWSPTLVNSHHDRLVLANGEWLFEEKRVASRA